LHYFICSLSISKTLFYVSKPAFLRTLSKIFINLRNFLSCWEICCIKKRGRNNTAAFKLSKLAIKFKVAAYIASIFEWRQQNIQINFI